MSRVEPNRNVYVGHRYVPKIFGEWDKKNEYEGLSIVTHQGASYTSKKRVPVGIDIKNDEFWVITGNYNSQIENYREEVRAMETRVNESLEVTVKKNELMVNVMDHGAKGDGLTDDSDAIQDAIDTAKTLGLNVFLPGKTFLINRTLFLNGVSMVGSKGNIYYSGIGTVIKCSNNLFTAISQGSVLSEDIQFNISDIIVENARVGFEINYAINSLFENLYAVSCEIAYKLGDVNTVGSMFNEFNNLYTKDCEIGIESESNEFFNNNVFNNGFIQGNQYAMNLKVTGGFGAVNNVFNNVEFRSGMGRGAVLTRATNTVFNQCYIETGGNAVRVGIASNVILNDCVYALFKKDNINKDNSIVFFEEKASSSKIDGGRIYLNAENTDGYFINTHNNYPFKWVTIENDVSLTNLSLAPNFKRYRSNYNHLLTNVKMDKFVNLKLNSQEFTRGELLKLSDFEVLNNTEKVNGSEVIVSEGYWTINANVKLKIGQTPATKYFYIRKNGVNIVSQIHSFESHEKDLERFYLNTVLKCNEGDKIEFVLLYENGDSTMNVIGGTQSVITLKYLG